MEKDVEIEFTHPLHITRALLEKGEWKSEDGLEEIHMQGKLSRSQKKLALALVTEAEKQNAAMEKEAQENLQKSKKISLEIAESCRKILIDNSSDGLNVEMDVFLTALSSCFIQWGLDFYHDDKEQFLKILDNLPDKVRRAYNLSEKK